MIEIIKKIIRLKETLLIAELKKRRKDKTAIQILIEVIAKQEGTDPDLAVRVALCESNFDPDARNWNLGYGYDRGLFQWNEKFHPEVSDAQAYDPEIATRLFCRAVLRGHLNWWKSSQSCWSTKISN